MELNIDMEQRRQALLEEFERRREAAIADLQDDFEADRDRVQQAHTEALEVDLDTARDVHEQLREALLGELGEAEEAARVALTELRSQAAQQQADLVASIDVDALRDQSIEAVTEGAARQREEIDDQQSAGIDTLDERLNAATSTVTATLEQSQGAVVQLTESALGDVESTAGDAQEQLDHTSQDAAQAVSQAMQTAADGLESEAEAGLAACDQELTSVSQQLSQQGDEHGSELSRQGSQLHQDVETSIDTTGSAITDAAEQTHGTLNNSEGDTRGRLEDQTGTVRTKGEETGQRHETLQGHVDTHVTSETGEAETFHGSLTSLIQMRHGDVVSQFGGAMMALQGDIESLQSNLTESWSSLLEDLGSEVTSTLSALDTVRTDQLDNIGTHAGEIAEAYQQRGEQADSTLEENNVTEASGNDQNREQNNHALAEQADASENNLNSTHAQGMMTLTNEHEGLRLAVQNLLEEHLDDIESLYDGFVDHFENSDQVNMTTTIQAGEDRSFGELEEKTHVDGETIKEIIAEVIWEVIEMGMNYLLAGVGGAIADLIGIDDIVKGAIEAVLAGIHIPVDIHLPQRFSA